MRATCRVYPNLLDLIIPVILRQYEGLPHVTLYTPVTRTLLESS